MRRACFFVFTVMLCSGFALSLAGDPGACGGSTGVSCGAGQFCKLPNGCDPDAEGVCTDAPTNCPPAGDGDWVCGCDGETYDNECLADLAGVAVERAGVCGGSCDGAFGIPCNEGEFCQLNRGEPCCCDFPQTCVPLPTECPAHCQPVCGCNSVTYRTECDAMRAFVQTSRPGRCNEVHGLRFLSAELIEWESEPGAIGYNVYLDGDAFAAESSGPACQAAGLQTTTWPVPSVPDLGELWKIEVTAEFSHGEGPMGMGSLCGNRQAGQSCGN